MRSMNKRLNTLVDSADKAIKLFSNMIDSLNSTNKGLEELKSASEDIANEHLSMARIAEEKIYENNRIIDKINKIID